jgi:hypothetical protein
MIEFYVDIRIVSKTVFAHRPSSRWTLLCQGIRVHSACISWQWWSSHPRLQVKSASQRNCLLSNAMLFNPVLTRLASKSDPTPYSKHNKFQASGLRPALSCTDSSISGARGPTIQSSIASHWLQVFSAPSISASCTFCRGRRKGTDSCGDMSYWNLTFAHPTLFAAKR